MSGMKMGKVMGVNGNAINIPDLNDATNALNSAKDEFIKTINDKSKWAALFLFGVSFFLIWVIIYYIYSKLSLESNNNKRMKAFYKSLGGTKISEITGCKNEKDCETGMHTNRLNELRPKLRDFYIMSSYNTCCGGNTKKDWVSMKPLVEVISQGVRFLDFEVYSDGGKPIIAAGPEANPDGKYCIKGTYNHLNFDQVMNKINNAAFTLPSNKNDPLFLNFRIKTNSKGVYDNMYESINNYFGGKGRINRLVSENLRYDGGKVNSSNDNTISNVPLYQLKGKVIISVKDVNHGYIGKKFSELISISDKNKAGIGMPYINSYKNLQVKDAYDPQELITENKQYLGITYPDFTNSASNSSAALHHKLGFQFVTMNFHIIDQHLKYYLTFFNNAGSAFVLKPENLRYKRVTINKPKEADKNLSFEPKEMSIMGGEGKLAL
jgi:hypothetical protein